MFLWIVVLTNYRSIVWLRALFPSVGAHTFMQTFRIFIIYIFIYIYISHRFAFRKALDLNRWMKLKHDHDYRNLHVSFISVAWKCCCIHVLFLVHKFIIDKVIKKYMYLMKFIDLEFKYVLIAQICLELILAVCVDLLMHNWNEITFEQLANVSWCG